LGKLIQFGGLILLGGLVLLGGLIFYSEDAGRVFGLDSQTLIQIGLNIINVALLALALSKLLYNPVRNFMQNRDDRIRSQLNHAQKESDDALALKLEYEQKLAEIDTQRNVILEEARVLATDNRSRMMMDAKAEAEALKARAASEIEGERERVREEMRQAIIEVSSLMAEKLCRVSVDSITQERLFDEAMRELGGMSWRS